MKKFAFILALLMLPTVASAGWWYVPNGSGYYFRTNGTSNDGWLYSKSYSCDSCGRRTYSWVKHSQIAGYGAPAYTAPPSKSAAEIGAGMLLKSEEFKFLRETAAQAFGTPGGYYQQAGYEQRGNTAYGPAHQSGYTLQSFQTITPQPLDVEALMERATRMATQAQDHGAAATAQAQGLLGQAQAGQQAIAQTFAQAARELSVMQALQPIQPQQVQAQTQFHATASASSGQAEAPLPTQAQGMVARYQAIVTKNCVSCHDAESPDGGLNLAGDVAALDKERRYAMMLRVTTDDVAKRMPKDQPPLSDSDQMVFVKATLD